MKSRSESILFLIVGLIAGISGAHGLLYGNYQETSGWLLLWNVFRFVAGLTAIVAGVKGIFKK